MSYFKISLNEANANDYFRKEVYTGNRAQLVLMSLLPNEDIGKEAHSNVDQVLIVVNGRGTAIINGAEFSIQENNILYIPSGAEHNIINTGSTELKLVSLYTPPEHPRGTVHKTKAEALSED